MPERNTPEKLSVAAAESAILSLKKLSANAAEFAELPLEDKEGKKDKRKEFRAREDTAEKKVLFSLLSQDEKDILKGELKKSIAKMMVYWVVHTRHVLLDDLLSTEPGPAWAGLGFARKVFEEEPEFLNKVSQLFKTNEHVKEGAREINSIIHNRDWFPELVPDCPADEILNVMYDAAESFVNNGWE